MKTNKNHYPLSAVYPNQNWLNLGALLCSPLYPYFFHINFSMHENTVQWPPFWVLHCTIFPGCACLNVSHLKLLKDFHNIFAYYVRMQPRQKFFFKNISFHFIKWEIGIYLWKWMQCTYVLKNTNIFQKSFKWY
jgi:hypothetical protein